MMSRSPKVSARSVFGCSDFVTVALVSSVRPIADHLTPQISRTRTHATLNVFASGSAREKDGEEKSKQGSDQCFPDRIAVKRPDSSIGDQKAGISHSYGPENNATTAHGGPTSR